MDLSQEEAEERSFVPSAISVPPKVLVSVSQLMQRTLSFWQFASVVIKEGEESYTTNSCQQFYNKSLVARGDKPLTSWQWYEFVGTKEHRGRLWRLLVVPVKDQEQRSFERMPRKKGKQEYEANGSVNRQPGSTWSK